MTLRMGFIVNPIAGMGGRVGLKGTDGRAYLEALKKGAKPVSPQRAIHFLDSIKIDDIEIISAPKTMGEYEVLNSRHRDKLVEVVDGVESQHTTAEDTKRIAKKMLGKDIDILVFVGGDGTARDILDAVDMEIVVLGVPSGVKIYSAVFAVSPEAAAKVIEAMYRGNIVVVEREVLDIDEEAFRNNRLSIKLYGYMKTPLVEEYIQVSKEPSLYSIDEEENKKAIAKRIVEEMEKDTLYILGPGTTIKAIADELGVEKTLLGVDAVYNGRLVGKDLDEKSLLKLIDMYGKAKIVVTPIGGQGFIFGRGNQQISPEVIKKVGDKRNIIVVATWGKIRDLKVLRVDTGDPVVDSMLRNYIKVIVDYNESIVRKVV